MNTKIMKFLNERPGYAKKGAKQLRRILADKGIYASNEEVGKSIKKFKELHNPQHSDRLQEILEKEGVKSIWTIGKDGDFGYSMDVKDQDKYRQLNEFKAGLIHDLRSIRKPKEYNPEKKGESLLEISIPDFHFGKVDGLTIEQQSDKFIDAVASLHAKASAFSIDRILLPIGNDFFNTDTIHYTTTKGTPQRDNSHWQESFRTGWKSVVAAIDHLSKHHHVDVVMVQGNHDYTRCFYLGEVIQAFYHNDKAVKVDNSFNSPQKFYRYGKVLLGFTHGDKERPNELPLLMAKQAKDLWSQTEHHEWHIGHLHKHMHDEYQGVGVKVLPSLTGQDEWHKMMGYAATKKAQAYIWNATTGLEGYIQINE